MELTSASAGGTRLVLTQMDVAESAVGYGAGWLAYLCQLDRHVSGDERSEPEWQADFERTLAMFAPLGASDVVGRLPEDG